MMGIKIHYTEANDAETKDEKKKRK